MNYRVLYMLQSEGMMDEERNALLKAADLHRGRRSALATTSFLTANLSLVGLMAAQFLPALVYFYLLFVPAIVSGHLARRAFRRKPGTFRNEAMAAYGLAVGYLGLVLSVFAIMALVRG